MATIKDQAHYVGEDVKYVVETVIPAGADINDYDIRFRLYATAADGTVTTIAEKTSASGINVIDATHYEIDLTDGTSFGLAVGKYRYGIRFVNAPDRTLDVLGKWQVKDWPL